MIEAMSTAALALEKMQSLSPKRAQRVAALIDDLATLEQMEDAEDAAAAQAALLAHERDGGAISLDELEARIAT